MSVGTGDEARRNRRLGRSQRYLDSCPSPFSPNEAPYAILLEPLPGLTIHRPETLDLDRQPVHPALPASITRVARSAPPSSNRTPSPDAAEGQLSRLADLPNPTTTAEWAQLDHLGRLVSILESVSAFELATQNRRRPSQGKGRGSIRAQSWDVRR